MSFVFACVCHWLHLLSLPGQTGSEEKSPKWGHTWQLKTNLVSKCKCFPEGFRDNKEHAVGMFENHSTALQASVPRSLTWERDGKRQWDGPCSTAMSRWRVKHWFDRLCSICGWGHSPRMWGSAHINAPGPSNIMAAPRLRDDPYTVCSRKCTEPFCKVLSRNTTHFTRVDVCYI